MTKVSAKAFAAFLEERAAKKDGYIMGATGQAPGRLSSRWFSQYSGRQYEKALYWRAHAERVWDCNGLAEGYYADKTGKRVNVRARDNYAAWCGAKGRGLIPPERRVPGAAVFWGTSAAKITHVAFLTRPVDEARMRTAARKSDARRALSRKTARAHGGAKERCASRTIAEDDAGARQCEKATRGTRCRGGRRKRTAMRKGDARHALSRKTMRTHGGAKERRARSRKTTRALRAD